MAFTIMLLPFASPSTFRWLIGDVGGVSNRVLSTMVRSRLLRLMLDELRSDNQSNRVGSTIVGSCMVVDGESVIEEFFAQCDIVEIGKIVSASEINEARGDAVPRTFVQLPGQEIPVSTAVS
jgi:hypothetical protein